MRQMNAIRIVLGLLAAMPLMAGYGRTADIPAAAPRLLAQAPASVAEPAPRAPAPGQDQALPLPLLLAGSLALIGILGLILVLKRSDRPPTAKRDRPAATPTGDRPAATPADRRLAPPPANDRPTVVDGPAIQDIHLPPAALIDLKGNLFQEPARLVSRHVRIGRTPTNDIVIPRETVSSRHATLDYRDGAFYLEDQGSSNGTWRNDQRLEPHRPVRLDSGDRLRFAAYALQFQIATARIREPAQRETAADSATVANRSSPWNTNDFAVALYRQLATDQEGKNLFFSPFSVAGALAMAAEGACGETARQIGTVLRFPAQARRPAADPTPPWDTAPIRAYWARFTQDLRDRAASDPDQSRTIRDQIARLEAERQTLHEQRQGKGDEADDGGEAGRWMAVLQVQQRLAAITGELRELRQQVDRYELRSANALWGEQTFPFRPAFLETLRAGYGAAAFAVDFVHDAEAARRRINRWVEQQTHDRIQDLLPSEMVDSLTRLVLTNAIYFKGNWAEAFDPAATRPADFTCGDGATVQAPMMAATLETVGYAALIPDGTRDEVVFKTESRPVECQPHPEGVQLLELPYRGDTLTLVVLLPGRPDGVPRLERHLTPSRLTQWLGALQQQAVEVVLPRFRLGASYGLRETLAALGMPAAFCPGGFTGMSDAPDADRWFLSEVVHKAWVTVNEEGTEAAAATAVVMGTMMGIAGPPPPTFRADRPFLFLIRDRQTDSILFLGRVLKPETAEAAP